MVYHQQKLPATFQCDGSAGGLFAKKIIRGHFSCLPAIFFAGFLPNQPNLPDQTWHNNSGDNS